MPCERQANLSGKARSAGKSRGTLATEKGNDGRRQALPCHASPCLPSPFPPRTYRGRCDRAIPPTTTTSSSSSGCQSRRRRRPSASLERTSSTPLAADRRRKSRLTENDVYSRRPPYCGTRDSIGNVFPEKGFLRSSRPPFRAIPFQWPPPVRRPSTLAALSAWLAHQERGPAKKRRTTG